MMMLTRTVFCICLVLRNNMETLLQNSSRQHMETRDLQNVLNILKVEKVTLITRPRIDLYLQPRYIPDQCKMLLKLTPNKSSFVLMSDKNDAKYALKIHSCKCSIRRVKITDTTKIALQSTIEQHHDLSVIPFALLK